MRRRVRAAPEIDDSDDRGFAAASLLILGLLSAIALGGFTSAPPLHPPAFLLFGVLTFGWGFLAFAPILCAAFIRWRQSIPTFKICVLTFAAILLASNTLWYLTSTDLWESRRTVTGFVCCLSTSLIGALLCIRSRGIDSLPNIGWLLQWVNLVMFSYPITGEML